MPVLAATWFDAGLVAVHAGVLIIVAAYFFGERRTVVAGDAPHRRPVSAGWLAIAGSFPALVLPWMTLSDLSGSAYDLGYRLWLLPIAWLLALPIVALVLVPLSQRLGGASALDYLEARFGPAARRFAAVTYGLGRWWLAAGVLAWSGRQAAEGAGIPVPGWLVVLVAGGLATLCAVGAGRRGLPWMDLWQSAVLFGGLALVLIVILNQPGASLDAIATTARQLGRSPAFSLDYESPDGWSLLIALPGYLALAVLSLGIDPVAHQRWSNAGNTGDTQRSLLLGGAALAAVLTFTVYSGVGLVDFYHRRPDALRGRWVANLDGLTRRSLTDPATRHRPRIDPRTGQPLPSLLTAGPALDPTDGTPLLDWYADDVDAQTLSGLVAEQRLLRPNDQQPFRDARELLDPKTGAFDVNRVMLRRPNLDREAILNRRASAELLPWFVATQLPWGCVTIAWCGLLAGAVSSVASTACLLGRQLGGASAEGADGVRRRDAWTLVAGVAITGIATLLLVDDLAPRLLLPLAALALGPTATGMALGLSMRRGTAWTTIVGMIACLVITVAVLALAEWPTAITGSRPHPLWALPSGLIGGWLAGGVVALVASRPRSRADLRGLVLGCGPLGVRHEHSAAGGAQEYLASGGPATFTPPSQRWRD